MEDKGLTKLDVAALRKADAICFDHNVRASASEDAPRGNFIRAIKRAEPSERDPYATDVTHQIAVASGVRSYADDDHGRTFVAFHMIHSALYSPTWQTITGLLRSGDELTLAWVRKNSNGYLDDAGLVRDELRLHVQRGTRELVFKVGESVTKDNSARLVRLAD